MNKLTKVLLAVAIVLLARGLATEARAATLNWTATAGDWGTASNWSTGLLPASGDNANFFTSGTTASITATTGTIPSSGTLSEIDTRLGNEVIQTAGTVNATNVWVGGTYLFEGGTINAPSGFDISGRNLSNQNGDVIQTGGTLIASTEIIFCYKGTSPVADYNMSGGSLYAGQIRMTGELAVTGATCTFTQSGGSVTCGSGGILLGNTVISGTGAYSAIYNLNGGGLTIQDTTPFAFHQLGVPDYFDFDGGTLELDGTWNFASLTGIAGADFRVARSAATANTLAFTPVTLFGTTYTQITVAAVPEPGTLALLFAALAAGFAALRLRRNGGNRPRQVTPR